MAIAIKVENLSKIYRLGEIGTGTVSRDIERWVKTKVLKQEDPFLRIGESNDRSTKGNSDVVYSLQDINFEIEQGDAIGIIGRNGAGKSTLLKILSRVTAPTKGRISVKGRIASLLEVGTGFHPDLTGRENIYLNGSMLGMRKKEIDRRLDEIIDFSGVERYIDTPVKRYSSGMYVRLAFAVAAHLESEILIVDEVLAVGDAEFQKKCLGKMGDISKGEGRTVLFVSHNMVAVTILTKKSLLLKHGKVISSGETPNVVEDFLQFEVHNTGVFQTKIDNNKTEITFVKVETSNQGFTQANGKQIKFEIDVHLVEKLKDGAISLQIINSFDVPVIHTWLFNSEKEIFSVNGVNKFKCIIPNLRLYMGRYYCRIIFAENLGSTIIQTLDNICTFEVVMLDKNRDFRWELNTCAYLEDYVWEII